MDKPRNVFSSLKMYLYILNSLTYLPSLNLIALKCYISFKQQKNKNVSLFFSMLGLMFPSRLKEILYPSCYSFKGTSIIALVLDSYCHKKLFLLYSYFKWECAIHSPITVGNHSKTLLCHYLQIDGEIIFLLVLKGRAHEHSNCMKHMKAIAIIDFFEIPKKPYTYTYT